MSITLMVPVATQAYTYAQTPKIVHIKSVKIFIYQLYLVKLF